MNYKELGAAASVNDEIAKSGGSAEDVMAVLGIEPNDLLAFCTQRALRAALHISGRIEMLDDMPKVLELTEQEAFLQRLFVPCFLDGVCTGIRAQKSKQQHIQND